MQAKVYIHDRICDPTQASISVFDRGFLYGDSIYETARIYQGVPFALSDHLRRFCDSGRKIDFQVPWSNEFIRQKIYLTLRASKMDEAYLRVVATRGSGAMGLNPELAEDPQLIIYVLELPKLPSHYYESGQTAWLVSIRRNTGGAIDPQAKTGNYMHNVLAAGEARRCQADVAIILDAHGRVAEASAANVFAVIDDVLCTPPLDVGILSGITRKTIITLCQQHKIALSERILWPQDLERAQEIFLCSSIREITPIVRLNGFPVNTGQVGLATRQVHQLYKHEVQKYILRETKT